MHSRFGLTLMVNHACNLRCGYCYTGEKLSRPMPFNLGCRAIDRAVRSIAKGGTLELGFFGGEPLIEAAHILEWIEYAERQTSRAGQWLRLNLTTNGTIDTSDAWSVMRLTALELAISHDGLPDIHDRHRLGLDGRPSSDRAIRTIQTLLDEARNLRIVLVVRPDSVARLPAGLDFLYTLGVRQFDPSLDLWTPWDRTAIDRLASAVASVADWWGDRLPDCSVSWLDGKAAALAEVPVLESARCGYGVTQVAVAPSGNLYPCERVIGADLPGNAVQLPGNIDAATDFLDLTMHPERSPAECKSCALQTICSTTCRCSNHIRTGDVTRPDRLLCVWDQTCVREAARVLTARALVVD